MILVQDADLEYDPAEYPRLIQPILDNRADVVYGSRFIGDSHRVLYFWHSVANKAADDAVEHVHQPEPDRHGDLLQGLSPGSARATSSSKSNRFGFEPEITAKIAKKTQPAWRIYEVPISYSGRTYEEGKKIGLKDAIQAFYCIVRYWLAN